MRKFNRFISDIRCSIGGLLIDLGSKITDAVSISNKSYGYEWKRVKYPISPDRNATVKGDK